MSCSAKLRDSLSYTCSLCLEPFNCSWITSSLQQSIKRKTSLSVQLADVTFHAHYNRHCTRKKCSHMILAWFDVQPILFIWQSESIVDRVGPHLVGSPIQSLWCSSMYVYINAVIDAVRARLKYICLVNGLLVATWLTCLYWAPFSLRTHQSSFGQIQSSQVINLYEWGYDTKWVRLA